MWSVEDVFEILPTWKEFNISALSTSNVLSLMNGKAGAIATIMVV